MVGCYALPVRLLSVMLKCTSTHHLWADCCPRTSPKSQGTSILPYILARGIQKVHRCYPSGAWQQVTGHYHHPSRRFPMACDSTQRGEIFGVYRQGPE